MAVLESLIGAFIFINIMFAWAVKDNNYAHIDIGWGLIFVVIAFCSQYYANAMASFNILYIFLVALWGIRLAIYLFQRNHGKPEDTRYTEMRQAWSGHPHLNGYFRVFILQMILAMIVIIPIYPLAKVESFKYDFLFYLGISLWAIGYYFEAIGDYQKNKFKQDPANKGKICKVGLWKYTRHPNYFGEVTLWWGFWISLANKLPIWTIIGPLTINFLILKVSGIPMLEEKKKDDPDFKQYMKETNAFFPWFPKKS